MTALKSDMVVKSFPLRSEVELMNRATPAGSDLSLAFLVFLSFAGSIITLSFFLSTFFDSPKVRIEEIMPGLGF